MTRFFRLRNILALFAAAAFSIGAVAAQTSARVATDHAVSVLQPENLGFTPGETMWFSFRQELDDGWHVYWKNPGDSGLPLSFDWELPNGFNAGEILYPAPERIPVGPFVNFGHHGEPVFLASVTAPKDVRIGEKVSIRLNAEWLICEEICVPENGVFELTLNVIEAIEPNPVAARHFEKFRAEAPKAYPQGIRYYAEEDALTVVIDGAATKEDVFFFPAIEGVVEPSAPQDIDYSDNELMLRLTPGLAYAPSAIDDLPGILKIGAKSYEVSASRSAGAPPKSAMTSIGAGPTNFAPIWLLLTGAFFGGVLLNVMPCVFPILFVKATGFANSVHDRNQLRRHGLIYALGVLTTFGLLAALLLLLRAGGAQLGWGFHLQSPIVVLLSAYILFLVGLNFAGVFSVGQSAQNIGGNLASKTGDVGAFFTGALAVFVAAPCVGPFLSAPVGAAALLPPVSGMAIFLAMALGFALPFTLLSCAPWFARALPRPGAWMSTLKTVFAFPVFAAAAFFVWVLSQQASAGGFALALGGLIVLGFSAWAFEKGKSADIWRAIAFGALIIALAPTFLLGGADAVASTARSSMGGLSWSKMALEDERAAGRGVFVDFTAAWCVTCQVNKVTVLSRDSVKSLFAENDVAFMIADWTRRDPAITEVLQQFGANGVPFYVYYPPEGAPRVVELPLTEARIAAAIEG